MTKIIKCVSKDCGYEEPTVGDEWMYRTTSGHKRAVRGQGEMVLCAICNSQTILIDDK